MKKLMTWAATASLSLAVLAGPAVKTGYVERAASHVEAFEAEKDVPACAGWSPFSIALVPAAQWPLPCCDVYGLRLNVLVGRHLDVCGLDIGGFGNFATREFDGVQVAGLFNVLSETQASLQVAGALNWCSCDFYGLQVGLVNVAEQGCGVQVGAFNYGNTFNGVQVGLVNVIRSSRCRVLPVVNVAF